jgi:hypothetical protein
MSLMSFDMEESLMHTDNHESSIVIRGHRQIKLPGESIGPIGGKCKTVCAVLD